uniref:Uncharacterized protein n=1 Tax=Psilocybe cubensis TaxID=181762 RepID=A0A8H7XN33_PSICU
MPSESPHNQHESSIPEAKGVARLTVNIPSTYRGKNAGGETEPLWLTKEFKFYYLVALFAIPAMIWVPVSVSQPSHPNYPHYAPKLSAGWLYGRLVDNSDAQYRSFRDNIPILCKAAFGYLIIKNLAKQVLKTSINLIPLNSFLSLAMIIALHGSSSLKIILIMSINYLIAKKCRGSQLSPFLTWSFNGTVLFMNEIYRGYSFQSLSSSLSGLDSFSGIYPRWYVMFNLTMLRLVSFNMDYYWSFRQSRTDFKGPPEKQRVVVSHSDYDYSLLNYIAYVLYPPLYIAGPIMTFNDFVSQFILHFMYVVAIKDRKAWGGDSPAELAMISFWNLIIVWLKVRPRSFGKSRLKLKQFPA